MALSRWERVAKGRVRALAAGCGSASPSLRGAVGPHPRFADPLPPGEGEETSKIRLVRILAVDVGTGTQDILLWDSSQEVENALQLVMPSPTVLAALVYVTWQTAKDTVIGRPSLLVTLGVLVLAGIYYIFRRREWTLSGPEEDPGSADEVPSHTI